MNLLPPPIISESIQEHILEILKKRFGPDPVIQTFETALDAIDDAERLKQLLHAACHAHKVENFRQVLAGNRSADQPNATTPLSYSRANTTGARDKDSEFFARLLSYSRANTKTS